MKETGSNKNPVYKLLGILVLILFFMSIVTLVGIDSENLDANNLLPTLVVMAGESDFLGEDGKKQTQSHYNINKHIQEVVAERQALNRASVNSNVEATYSRISPTPQPTNVPPTQIPATVQPSVQLDMDQDFVSIDRDELAVNSGHITGFDPLTMQIESSSGMFHLMDDNSWLWTYSTENILVDNQTITINVLKNGQIIARRGFSLIITEPDQIFMATDESLIVDQPLINVAQGNLAVNSGRFVGSVAEIQSSGTSYGNIEILPDGSWLWTYSTQDEIVESSKMVSINVQTMSGNILQSTFQLNITPQQNIIVASENVADQPVEDSSVIALAVVEPQSPSTNPGEPAVLSTDVIINPTVAATQVPNTVGSVNIVATQVVVIPSATNLPQTLPTQVITQAPTQIPVESTEADDEVIALVLETQAPPTMTQVIVEPTQAPPTMTQVIVEPTQAPPTMTQVIVEPTQVPPTMTQVIVEPTQVPPTMTPVTVSTLIPTTTPSIPVDGAYYVSKSGNNGDGRSWATAWNELDQIDWSIINPGDTIYLDGGVTQMQYNTNLEFGKSGQPNNPIRILASSEAGHNGQVIFFGGRDKPLPYCDQPSYDNSDADQLIQYGIQSRDHSYIVIDGMDWRGIAIHGYGRSGIRIDRHSNNITFRHLEVYNNGRADYNSSARNWDPDSAGIRIAGENMTFQRVIVHDNGQDAFQSLFGDNNLSNFRLEQSWLYNGRKHPTVDESSNYCTHTDGIQIYSGGVVSGINVTQSIFGPGFTHNLILGQTRTSSGESAVVHDLFLQDVVLSKAADNNLHGYSGTSMHNWTLDRVTIHCPKTKGHCARAYNSDHSITNSVFYGSRLTFPDGVDNTANNCIWQTSGYSLGLEVNPNFRNVSDIDHFSLDDYTVQNPSCVGSQLTSVNQLFSGLSNNSSLAQPVVSAPGVQIIDIQSSVKPTIEPTMVPTDVPTLVPTDQPTTVPTDVPTLVPTDQPTMVPTNVPTLVPTDQLTMVPTDVSTLVPTDQSTMVPTNIPEGG